MADQLSAVVLKRIRERGPLNRGFGGEWRYLLEHSELAGLLEAAEYYLKHHITDEQMQAEVEFLKAEFGSGEGPWIDGTPEGDILWLTSHNAELRAALIACAVPLEALNMDNQNGAKWMAPSVKQHVAEAVAAIRSALRITENPTTSKAGNDV